MKFWLPSTLALLVLMSPQARSEPVKSAHTEAELVAESTSIEPGTPFTVALRLKTDRRWHTYWRNPGDSGLATDIDWQLPEGFTAGPIEWPYPKKIDLPPLSVYGYDGEVFLFTKISSPDNLPAGTPALIRAHARWLACEVNCIPGQADLSLALPVSAEKPEPDASRAKEFSRFRAMLPLPASAWTITAAANENSILIEAAPPAGTAANMTGLAFFPYDSELIAHAAKQQFMEKEGRGLLLIKRSRLTTGPLEQLSGVLVSPEGWRGPGSEKALEIKVPVRPLAAVPSFPEAPGGTPGGLLPVTALAFLGGILLNLMPCVFPVLSLKILGFVDQSHHGERRIWHHGAAFSAGVLVSFWLLAGLLMALRAAGESVGWGYQLQSPYFVAVLIFLFFLMGLNLLGLFEVGLSLTGLGTPAVGIRGLEGAFVSGVLATVVATPCTAPFMGTAVGYALTRPPFAAFLVFTCLGAGMAFPYMALSLFPGLVDRLPDPGPWMVKLKKALSVLLFATVAWLVWVFSLETGPGVLPLLFAGLILSGAAAWIYGAQIQTGKGTRLTSGISLLLFAAGAALVLGGPALESGQSRDSSAIWKNSEWLPYSPEALEKARSGGRPVLLDFTAAWCLTCQVNERVALGAPEVRKKFREMDVLLMKADWTNRDETVSRALASFGRTSIPLYVLYGPGKDGKERLLPEILTPKTVLDALEDISGNRRGKV